MPVRESYYSILSIRENSVIVSNNADGRSYVYDIEIVDGKRCFTVRGQNYFIDD